MSGKPSLNLRHLDAPAVFETIRVYRGVAAGLEEHAERLRASARALTLPVPDAPVIADRVKRAIAASGFPDAIARLSVNVPSVRPFAARGSGNGPVMSCSVRPFAGCPEPWYENGVALLTAGVRREGPRGSAPRVKGNDYLNAIAALLSGPPAAASAAPAGMRAAGADPLLLTDAGTVSETSVANVLILKHGALWTPPASCGILLGVTRRIVLGAARRSGLTVRETAFTRHDIYNADEVHITNAAVEVLPVVEVDGRRIALGRPGPWAARLRDAYLRQVLGR